MCGIAGIVTRNARHHVAALSSALNTIAHRGPDDSGVHASARAALGHRRLSIIDLSAAGHQPMASHDGSHVIVFNGEIYNYVELKAELEGEGFHFTGSSDTEVLLAAIMRWGTGAFTRLNGMWALAVWNEQTGKLLVCRDRFGKKPFYFAHVSDRFVFASEPKAIIAMMPELRRANDAMLRRFLAEGQLACGSESFYRDIRALPGGCFAEYDVASGQLRQSRYWDYPAADADGARVGEAEFMEAFESTFMDAVKIRLRSDVPVGISLSGGLDSTAVLAAACDLGEARPQCITSTYGASGEGELNWAKIAAAPFGIEPITAEAPASGAMDIFRRVAWHMDSPTYSPAVYPLWCLMQAVRARGIKVMLEGQGADELLGGYTHHAAAYLADRLRRLQGLPGLVHDARKISVTHGVQGTMLWTLRTLLPWTVGTYRKTRGAASVLREPYEWGEDQTPGCDPRYDALTRILHRDHAHAVLPALLHYGDAVSMAHGVESRQPFLDYRLVELVMPWTGERKLRGGESKWPIRAFLRDHRSSAIADRTDKKGYVTPLGQWMSANDGRLLKDVLLAKDTMIHEWADPNRIRRLVDMFLSGAAAVENHLFRLVSAELWLQECIASSPAEIRAAA